MFIVRGIRGFLYGGTQGEGISLFSDTLSLDFGYVTDAKFVDLNTNPLIKRRRPKNGHRIKKSPPLAVP